MEGSEYVVPLQDSNSHARLPVKDKVQEIVYIQELRTTDTGKEEKGQKVLVMERDDDDEEDDGMEYDEEYMIGHHGNGHGPIASANGGHYTTTTTSSSTTTTYTENWTHEDNSGNHHNTNTNTNTTSQLGLRGHEDGAGSLYLQNDAHVSNGYGAQAVNSVNAGQALVNSRHPGTVSVS